MKEIPTNQRIDGAMDSLRSAAADCEGYTPTTPVEVHAVGRCRATMRMHELRALTEPGVLVLTASDAAMVRKLWSTFVEGDEELLTLAESADQPREAAAALEKRLGIAPEEEAGDGPG